MNAPAMPSRIVTIKPPGSFPGINSFAITPTTRPTRIVERIAIVNRVVSDRFVLTKEIDAGKSSTNAAAVGWKRSVKRAQRDAPTKKATPAWSNEPEPGHNRGDDLPADDTQLPSVG